MRIVYVLAASAALAIAAPAAGTEDFAEGALPSTSRSLAAAAAATGASSLVAVAFEAGTPGIGAYKTEIARLVASGAAKLHTEDLPPILKSVVVLDVTIDRTGRPVRVVVWRSNGYPDLESTAVDSVKSVGAFPAPSEALLAGADRVRYLETFLFRHDGKFQIRSLEQPVMPVGANPVARR